MSNAMPWIRFHLYDWISGTNGMTSEQRGVYITLLVCMYEKKNHLKQIFKHLHAFVIVRRKNLQLLSNIS